MIKLFYRLTFPRYKTNEKKYNKFINILFYAEYLAMGKVCELFVRHFYPKKKKKLNTEKRESKIVVSLTTIPSRINTLPVMLKSIFNQTVMPDRVILWITDEISDRNSILKLLKAEIEAGLEVRFVKDVRVHTKYYYAMKEFPEDLIITVDDDILYPENLIESLYKVHSLHKHAVIAARAHEITTCGDVIKPYKKWHMLAPGVKEDAANLIATGVGGVLYPPHCLYKDWENTELFLSLCPTADDIWLKIMESLNGTSVFKLHKYTREAFIIGNTQTFALSKSNVGEGRNDKLLAKCKDHYKFSASIFNDPS